MCYRKTGEQLGFNRKTVACVQMNRKTVEQFGFHLRTVVSAETAPVSGQLPVSKCIEVNR
jgi:hypothetical protein